MSNLIFRFLENMQDKNCSPDRTHVKEKTACQKSRQSVFPGTGTSSGGDHHGLFLRLQAQLGSLEGMRLGHGLFRTVQAV